MAWTEERLRILRRWWGKGKTAREIAEMTGMPRNAVIGKAHRLCGKRTKGTPPARPARPPKPRLVASRPAAPQSVAKGRVTMAELTDSTCRYPFGDQPRDLRFCAAPVQAGSSYCPFHHAACWDDPPTRKPGRQAAG